MKVTNFQTHWDSALVLFRQRDAWPLQELGDAAPLERLEQALRLHFHVLARCPEVVELQPEKTADCFVWLASQFSSPDFKVRQRGHRQAGEILVEGEGKGLGAYAALCLFSPPEDDHGTLDLYRNHEKLRPILFSLWREQGFQVPGALYNRAELQRRDPELQQAALAYAADNPKVSLELFRAYYQPLLGVARPVGVTSGVMCAALRGGLLRGDRDIPGALRRAIELEASSADQATLLRLGALCGDAKLYPVLRSRLKTQPQDGARLLALYARPEALVDLHAALDSAPAMNSAADAWYWMTGQRLARKPRLSLVGGEAQETTGATMPDSEAAHVWLEQNRANFSEEARLLWGCPMSIPLLQAAAQNFAGRGDADLLDLLAVHLQRPLGLTAGGWRSVRRQKLPALGGNTAKPNSAPMPERKGIRRV